MNTVFIHLLPDHLNEAHLEGCTAVVIDILRASTTTVHALAHGAAVVIPCLTVDDAFKTAENYPPESRLLGGERNGELIEGFDLDNSPLKYTPEVVRGKTVVYTTTNGTRALLRCGNAAQIFLGAFVNISAICETVTRVQRDLHLVCSGTDDRLTGEDILFAGAVADTLLAMPNGRWQAGNVQARMASDFYHARNATPELFREAIFESLGARNIEAHGMTEDIERAMQRDLFDCVPIWQAGSNRITLLDESDPTHQQPD